MHREMKGMEVTFIKESLYKNEKLHKALRYKGKRTIGIKGEDLA